MGSGRLIAVGDVHGCVHALDIVLEAIEPTAEDQLVFLGDIVDQGKESREVIERIIALRRQMEVVLIQGNHEEMMFAARESEPALRYWERCGGVATLNSYRFGAKLADIPAEHWKLLESCLPYFETDQYIFTHANYVADVAMPEQPEYTLRWALFDPPKQRPHISGKPIFVGHTEQKSGEVLDLGFAACIDTACWKYGWLTAIDVATKHCWQASRWGIPRDPGEESQEPRLKPLLRPETVAATS